MVLRVNSDYSSSSISTPTPNALPTTATSSLCSDSDLECGDSSQDDEHDVEIISKYIPSHGKTAPRRRSQCEQLSFRQRSKPSIIHQQQQRGDGSSSRMRIPPQPAAFRRWSTLVTSSNGDLPKTIQFSPTDGLSSSNSSHSNKRSPLLILATLALLAFLSILAINQRSQITALQSQLEITNDHRQYLEKSQSNLLSQLNQREASLSRYKHTHAQMTKVNQDMGMTMTKLREDHTRDIQELKRLRSVAAAASSSN
mmetsp:Transcript_8360/g.18733  ORF Transcript_8360/g.18733 Transcript_8360/m.18733 type:complete len:255 (-) Transcript_8360:297-1061(-)|eukprot:CAMPEP_0172312222 /NCGR_PEP_ID=MMETSP1058-20130122/17051_1 /TAXON_ID=83371 /ORGANISM="Detonula confervacea, Strain CCMP 353" /LENGTH=254 /DNA_ID=CAMNT_0013025621 /DNA_START=102 /DNA_END=866 /DNA_ORIENTATION=-